MGGGQGDDEAVEAGEPEGEVQHGGDVAPGQP